jgi:hypothetical protein
MRDSRTCLTPGSNSRVKTLLQRAARSRHSGASRSSTSLQRLLAPLAPIDFDWPESTRLLPRDIRRRARASRGASASAQRHDGEAEQGYEAAGAARRSTRRELTRALRGSRGVAERCSEARPRCLGLGRRNRRDLECLRRHIAEHAGRVGGTHRLGLAIVTGKITAVGARRRASAATRYVVPVARGDGRRLTLTGRCRATAARATEGRCRAATPVLDLRATLLGGQAAAAVVAGGVLGRAALGEHGHHPAERAGRARDQAKTQKRT